jgi:HlyD family secretion protein
VKHEIRRAIKRLELQLTQERLALENSRSRYNALLEPPDPVKVAAAEAELATAKAQLEAAEREWERIKDGFSPAEIAVLEAKLMDAQREWLRVKDGPDPDDITLMEAQIAAAQAAIQQMTIMAPFAGTLTNVRSQVNDLVATGTPAFQLDDLSTLHIDLAVSEIDINRVILGQEAVISLDSAPAKEYQGVVSEIGLVGTENFGVTNYRVRVEVAESDPDIKPGMSASVRIVVDEKENVLLVPSRAIHSLNGETVVYRWDNASEGRIAAQDNQIEEPGSDGEFRLPRIGIRPIQNQIHPVMVELGATSGADTEVVAGELNAGDVIVLNPPAE